MQSMIITQSDTMSDTVIFVFVNLLESRVRWESPSSVDLGLISPTEAFRRSHTGQNPSWIFFIFRTGDSTEPAGCDCTAAATCVAGHCRHFPLLRTGKGCEARGIQPRASKPFGLAGSQICHSDWHAHCHVRLALCKSAPAFA